MKYLKLSILFVLFSLFLMPVKATSLDGKDNESAAVLQIRVTGTVIDASGVPLPGVTVLVKELQQGTVTDADGKYSINVRGEYTVLSFSSIGYATQDIAVGNRTIIDVTMSEDTQELDEVIVVGYGTMRKADLTGAVVRVNMEEKETLANVTISQALSGAAPGISISPSGRAGQDPSINIRGQNSFTGDQAPLIVLDGVIYYGSISDINVNDVESIDVLKDASAAAVYGSRSANGVILITTKKGKEGKPRVSFNMFYGPQWMTNNPMKVMNGEQYAIRMLDYYYQESLYTWYEKSPTSVTDQGGRPVRPDASDRNIVSARLVRAEERDNYLAGNEVDWVKKALQPASIGSYNLSFSGRNERVNYFASASYIHEDGVMKFDFFKRYSIRVNLESKITDWLTMGINTAYSNRESANDRVANMEFARVASPWATDDTDLPAEDRKMYLTGENYMRHPLEREGMLMRAVSNSNFLIASAKVTVPWVQGLTYDFKMTNTVSSSENDRFYPKFVHDGLANNGRAERRPSYSRDWLMDNIISYLRTFGDHQVNATLLYSREGRYGRGFYLISENFENPLLGFENMTMGSQRSTSNASSWMQSGVSYMGRLNYTYKGTYMLTGTVRRDGSSTFPEGNKWATLPSISAGWVLSNEAFMKDLTWLYSKIRLSYGVNGNPGAGRYSSLSQVQTGNFTWDSGVVTVAAYPNPDRMGNKNLKWEKTTSLNFGIDFGLWKRINGSLEMFTGKTTDVIVQRGLPKASGFNSIRTNLGQLKNKGFEIAVNSMNLQKTALKWRTGVSFWVIRNEIVDLYGDETENDIDNGWFKGESIGAIYDFELNGIWQEEDLYSGKIGKNGTELQGWYPGQYKMTNLNPADDKVINGANDRKIIGNREANFRFTVSNTFNYKNWGLTVMINSSQGGGKRNWLMHNNYRNVNVQERTDDVRRINQSAVRQYWTPENRVNNATGVYNQQNVYSGIYEDRSFVRLQDITLSYNFDKGTLSKMGGFIDQFQVYISGRNLYTWTKWSGWDPEVQFFRYSDRSGQNEHNIAMRNLTGGIRLTF